MLSLRAVSAVAALLLVVAAEEKVQPNKGEKSKVTLDHFRGRIQVDDTMRVPPRKLSRAESKWNLKELMQKIDTDEDGKVSLDELKDWAKRGHKRLPTLIAEERFSGSDTNSDGLVSWLEHIKETFDLDSDEDIAKNLKGDYDNMRRTIAKIQEDRDLFAEADLDKDGYLNRKEYWDFNLPEDSDTLAPLLVKHQIGDRDKDQDGRLTYDEYVSQSNSYHDDPDPEKSKTDFERQDVNSDGILDKKELVKTFLFGNMDWKLEHVDELFEEADDDLDSLLSADEMVEYHDKFRNSPITEYGYHIDNLHDIKDEL